LMTGSGKSPSLNPWQEKINKRRRENDNKG
jgi:hypothetical protein